MTTNVSEEKTIILMDGTKIEIRPLKISLLRKFTNKFATIVDISDDNDKSMDVLMQCVQIAMEQYNPELAADIKSLEENIDLPTVYKILEEAGGINLSQVPGAL